MCVDEDDYIDILRVFYIILKMFLKGNLLIR